MSDYLKYETFECDYSFVCVDGQNNGYQFDVKKERCRMCKINCSQCNEALFFYQKRGDSPLLKCYLDRITMHLNLIVTLHNELYCCCCKKIISKPRETLNHQEREVYVLL